jgi:hypothetical protein
VKGDRDDQRSEQGGPARRRSGTGHLLLVLSRRAAHEARPAQPDELPHSPVFFTCSDIEQTYRELTDRGVEFPVPPARRHFGWWALFADPDGTRYALGQWDDLP